MVTLIIASCQILMPCTAKYFDRDPETNEVLWFAAPPMNVARPPAPKHSLAYLHFLAMKRKREEEGGDSSQPVDVEGEPPQPKRQRAPPTVMESIQTALSSVTSDSRA